MTKRSMMVVPALAVVLAMGLAACGGNGDGNGSAGKDADGSTSSAPGGGVEDTSGANGQGVGGHCGVWVPGQNGIVQTFCGGKGTVTLKLGKTAKRFEGAVCTPSGQYLTVNAGALASTTFVGEAPDYFGANFPPSPGKFSGRTVGLGFTLDGTSYAVRDVTGSHDGSNGKFTGTLIDGDGKVSGTFSC